MTIYGRHKTPLLAKVEANINKPDQVVGFIDGRLCFFERDSIQPEAGSEVEVMITRPHYVSKNGGNHRLAGIMIRVIEHSKHVLIGIDGFRYGKSESRSIAKGNQNPTYPFEVEDDSHFHTVSPGRSCISEANLNDPSSQPVPTNVYIDRVQQNSSPYEICGFASLEDCDFAKIIMKPGRPK